MLLWKSYCHLLQAVACPEHYADVGEDSTGDLLGALLTEVGSLAWRLPDEEPGSQQFLLSQMRFAYAGRS